MKTQRMVAFAIITVLFSLGFSPATAQSSGKTLEVSYPQLTKPTGIDLDVTYISRVPMYNRYSVLYTVDGVPYLQPGTENDKRWPSAGEVVTFTAHIKNKGTNASDNFNFKWFIDGVEVATGTHASLVPNQEGTESYPWIWGHSLSGEHLLGSHTVQFTVDPANLISETYESNNSLEDRTDAMSLVMALSPAAYAAFETPIDSQWPFSAEDWLQKQIKAMNDAFQRSVYLSVPNGILEHVRIDKILVTASLPPDDSNEDGAWYIANDVRNGGFYNPDTDVDGGLLHELTHQLGIIDMYNLDVSLETPQVLDHLGQPIQLEYSTGYLFPGLMNNPGVQPPAYDEHTALALNLNKGYRRGYYGEYLYDVSDKVYLRILDNKGQPAIGATIKLYQRSFDPGLYGGLFGTINNTPEIIGITDGNGKLLLTNRSVGTPVTTNTGHILHNNPLALINVVGNNDEFVLELTKGGHQEFSWLDITSFNLAMWRGGGNSATLNILSHIPSSNAPQAPTNLAAIQESGLVKLQWSASPSSGVTGYNIYRTNHSTYPYQRIVTRTTALSYSDPYDYNIRAVTYVVTAVDSLGRESGFSNPFYAFRLANPTGVVVDEQNGRIVLDPQNGYALLYQLGNGTFFDTRGSVDYHLEFSQYLSRDSDGRLIISHPADYYSSRHSVRVTDKNGKPLFEFGDQGPGVGQFQTPAGVAAWGKACGIAGPYSVDAQTLLLLHFNNSYIGSQGEVGDPNGVTFTSGKYAQGVSINSSDTLTYAITGNLNRTQGAIEFWIRPHWNGGDNQGYTFFEVGNDWFNRMRIMKDGANNLRFMLWNSTTEYGVSYNIGHWQTGEWHHIAATWIGANIALYVDGEQRASSTTANPPDILASTIYIGSSWWLDQQADADFDELRISDIPRVGNNNTCTYRILVADSGNNRIQAFDGQGNFIVAYGSTGSGSGQFNNPQGLAVDNNGNVVVADNGNNRLQVLGFNGFSFSFVRSITANFAGPTGIATYGSNHIVVADTGNNKVKVLDAQGNLVEEYLTPNNGRTGLFNQPRGVIVDKSARIIVADTGNKRIVSIIDALPVEVTSITRADPNFTRAAIIQFTVTFSKGVTGVNTNAPFEDFILTTAGVESAFITDVSGSGSKYTVTVNTGSGSGAIRLDVVDDDSIKDISNNPLGGIGMGNGNFTSGEEYSILKPIPAPGIPGLLSPVSGKLLNTLQPTLDWKDSKPAADHYRLQVSSNSIFTNLVIDETNLPTSNFIPAFNFDSGKQYYWRVRAFNVNGVASGWSTIWNFTTPLAQAILVSPADGSFLVTDRPDFDWEDVNGAVSYIVQVSPSSSFDPLLVNTSVRKSAYILPRDLPQQKLLYWRVRAKTSVVAGPWSEKWTFTTGNPPGVPGLVAPAANGLVKDYTPKLDWSVSTLPIGTTFKHYELQVDDNNDFSSPVINIITTDGVLTESSYTPPSDLAFNTKYYWRVRAVNTLVGVDNFSGWSKVWSFRAAILAPTLLSPANTSTVDSLKPTLNWADVTGATNYTVQIATNTSFGTILINVKMANSTFMPSVNLPTNKTLFWRVRANGPNGPSNWSSTFSFHTPQ